MVDGATRLPHLHALLAQQVIHRLQLRRAVEDDRFALVAVEVVQHFPVAQVAGDADHAFTRGQGLLQHFQAMHFLDQLQRALRRPDPGTGTFDKGFTDIPQRLAHQLLTGNRVHLREAFGQVDPYHVARTVGDFPHQPANTGADTLHSAPGQLGKQAQHPDHQGALELFHRRIPYFSKARIVTPQRNKAA